MAGIARPLWLAVGACSEFLLVDSEMRAGPPVFHIRNELLRFGHRLTNYSPTIYRAC
jgi:hypothetical protein